MAFMATRNAKQTFKSAPSCPGLTAPVGFRNAGGLSLGVVMNHLHTPIVNRHDNINYRCPVCTLPSPCALHEMCQVEGCYLPKPCSVHEPEVAMEMKRLALCQAAEEGEEGPRRSRRGSIDQSGADASKKGQCSPHAQPGSPWASPSLGAECVVSSTPLCRRPM